jgi:hypothetical protein
MVLGKTLMRMEMSPRSDVARSGIPLMGQAVDSRVDALGFSRHRNLPTVSTGSVETKRPLNSVSRTHSASLFAYPHMHVLLQVDGQDHLLPVELQDFSVECLSLHALRAGATGRRDPRRS